MAINQAMCGTYKKEITVGIHFWLDHTRTGSSGISADTFKIAMFTSSRTDANEDLTGYTATNEVSGTGARCAVIYNSTLNTAGTGATVNHAAYPSVCVLDFGGDKSSSAGDFTIQYPANDANNALIRIA